ncbi:uncharacterized protein EI90DRAFT_3034099 [Cantharellus anzutake]|uniref:uncharacterized protein n=1 Tax=Cantharellus anzutake TaxID=1750568 RepID=UPI00190785AB|nr:uncharacterized protein EI90DRAFT_3034099 [Cantharellus anzutake]KAF8341486.1 hypothetical protein EI90DRAFT_3034099 [Cantharellus anzutake]
MLRRIKSEYRPKDIRDTSSPAPGVGGLDRNVKIIITWVPHPAAKEHPPNTWDYIIDRDSDLRQIFKNIAGQKHIFAHDLVVTHEDHQIHGMKTPRQLEGLVREIHLSASEKNTYDIIRELRRQGKSQPEPSNLNDEENGDGGGDDADAEPKVEEVRKIRLDLKSKPFPEAKRMNVKATTACRSILAAYLKAVGVDPGKKGVRLMFEGESLALDKPIGSHDLDLDEDDEDDEDPSGVQIDVVGL